MFPKVFKSRMEARAFSYKAPLRGYSRTLLPPPAMALLTPTASNTRFGGDITITVNVDAHCLYGDHHWDGEVCACKPGGYVVWSLVLLAGLPLAFVTHLLLFQ